MDKLKGILKRKAKRLVLDHFKENELKDYSVALNKTYQYIARNADPANHEYLIQLFQTYIEKFLLGKEIMSKLLYINDKHIIKSSDEQELLNIVSYIPDALGVANILVDRDKLNIIIKNTIEHYKFDTNKYIKLLNTYVTTAIINDPELINKLIQEKINKNKINYIIKEY